MVLWLSGCVCCVMFHYSMRSCVRSQPMYFFSSNNNYVIQKYTLSPEGMFANTRFSREQCWQTLLFVLRENVCKYLTRTIELQRILEGLMSCNSIVERVDIPVATGLTSVDYAMHLV
jgi:hypothetical protein